MAVIRKSRPPGYRRTEEEKRKHAAYMRAHLAKKREDPAYLVKKAANDRRQRLSLSGKVAAKLRKAKRRNERAVHALTAKEWANVVAVFGKRCVYCGREETLTLDHFIPLAKGGHTILGNVLPACMSCNTSKRDVHPSLWCQPCQYSKLRVALMYARPSEAC